MNLQVGQVLQHEYTLNRKLGKGGQAEVWEVRDPQGRLLALKTTISGNPERLRRESNLLQRLKHPCLPLWTDFFLLPNAPCMVFELIQGISLGEAMQRPQQRLDDVQREAILRQLASTLAYLHQERVIHRDLQPDNVLLTPDFWSHPDRLGTVKLIDFGIAAEEGNQRPLTQEGSPRQGPKAPQGTFRGPGSTPYMAPEMLDSSSEQWADRADPRIDIFAFGVLGWGLFTGKHPVGGPLGQENDEDHYRKAYRMARSRPDAWPADRVDFPLAGVLMRCFRIEREERPANGRILCSELQGDLGETTTHDPAASPPPPKFAPIPTPEAPSVRTSFPSPRPPEATSWSPSIAPAPNSGKGLMFLLAGVASLGALLAGVAAWDQGTLSTGQLPAASVSVSVIAPQALAQHSAHTASSPTLAPSATPVSTPAASVAPPRKSCSADCGDWELCVQGKCSSKGKSRSLRQCRVVLSAGVTEPMLYEDKWLRKPSRKVSAGTLLNSVRFDQERVLIVADGRPNDRYLSRDLVECD